MFGKLLGAGLGWAFGGPIGAIIGFTVGSMLENTTVVTKYGKGAAQPHRYRTTQSDFAVSLLVLSAAVMKADGKVLQSELNYVKQFFNQNFGATLTKELIPTLQQILKQKIPVKDVCEQIRHNMRHPLRLQLLHYLFGISKADGRVDKSEVDLISQISYYLGISDKDFQSIKAMFYKDTESGYKILEITKSATDQEVKKAYRRMAVKYHPDKVAQLGEEFQKAAKEKFLKVQEAYENIKKERGMN